MKKNYILDFIAYKIARVLGVLFLVLSPGLYVALGGFFGKILFYFDAKHRNIVYRNLRFIFCSEKNPRQINKIAKQAFENFGRNLFETLALKRVNKEYINKYMQIEGTHFIDQALAKKKGLIFVTLHLGNWEISNAACGLLYQPYNVIVKEQKHGLLNSLLDSYRKNFGIKTVGVDSLKEIIKALENNEIVSIVSDHGAGESDIMVDFFGRDALMPQGAARLGAKFKTPLIFAYIVRAGGAHHKAVLEPFDSFLDSGDKEKDLRQNLKTINKKFEGYIRKYPEQYLWSYKKWKHSKARSVLILSDEKTGHLRQSEAAAKIIYGLGFDVRLKIIKIKFRDGFSRALSHVCFAAKRFTFLKRILTDDCYEEIANGFFDIVISCGASLAPLNLIISGENKAKAVHIMRPGPIFFGKFDLLIIPCHDHPPLRKNIIATNAALNLIDKEYLKSHAEKLVSSIKHRVSGNYIGFLIGGDTKDYKLSSNIIKEAACQIKRAAEKLNADILVTTSRRTPKGVEVLLKNELSGFPNCKLLVIANEKNITEAVGGILALSSVVIVTAESISMISEAVSSAKYVIVINDGSVSRRHKEFLDNLSIGGYIYMIEAGSIGDKIEELLTRRPAVKTLNDRDRVAVKLKEIL